MQNRSHSGTIMVLKILKANSGEYQEKLKKIRAAQLESESKRWAAVTDRNLTDALTVRILRSLLNKTVESGPHLTNEITREIETSNPDIEIIQGNLKLEPALKLIDDIPVSQTTKIKERKYGRSI